MNNIKSTTEFKATARKQLSGKYSMAVAICFLYFTIRFAAELFSGFSSLASASNSGAIMGLFISFLVIMFSAGFSYFFLNISRDKDYNLSDLFYMLSPTKGLSNLIALMFGSFLIESLSFVVLMPGLVSYYYFGATNNMSFLGVGTLLLIVGIVLVVYFNLSFFFFPYVCIDNTTPATAISLLIKSGHLIKGNRLKLLYILASFIGWGLLGILTFGIGFLWIAPYYKTSMANFYNSLLESLDS